MSVIAKMFIKKMSNFGTGQLFELDCVCENDLIAAYAGSEENHLFTKYSPWGEMKVHQPSGFGLGMPGDQLYVMIMRDNEVHNKDFPGAWLKCQARCVSVTDFGGTSRNVEFCNGYEKNERVDGLNWKMSVDNPPASAQFEPGKSDYWIALYPASNFDRNKTIAAAHGD